MKYCKNMKESAGGSCVKDVTIVWKDFTQQVAIVEKLKELLKEQ